MCSLSYFLVSALPCSLSRHVVYSSSQEHISSSLSSLQVAPIRLLYPRRRLKFVPLEVHCAKFSSSIQCRALESDAAKTPDKSTSQEEWLLKNDSALRALPLVVAAIGGSLIILNRWFSGIAAIADAGSSQSRADVLCLALSATLALNGLVWKSLQPKVPVTVVLEGVDCLEVDHQLPPHVQAELKWVWEALKESSCCKSLVIVYRGVTVLQAGMAQESDEKPGLPVGVDGPQLLQGSLCSTVLETGKVNYMANLTLYPWRFQLPFLPQNTQAVIAQPVGSDGIMLVAGDMMRGFGPLDQAWISIIAQKVDSSLADSVGQETKDSVELLSKNETTV